MDHNYARNCKDIPCVGERRSVTIPDPGGERKTVEKTDLSLDMKTFLVVNKSLSYKEVVKLWNKRFERAAPTRRTVDRVLKKAREENSVQSRKFKSGRKRTVRTPEIINEIKRVVLEEESDARPNQTVNRARSNQWGINRQTFCNIMKDLGCHPYVPRRHQIISPANIQRRLDFCNTMNQKPDEYFENMIITDEKTYVAKGHVYSRSLCVKWSKFGEGSPINWFTESSVYPTKLMVFAAVTGNGELFGPYFIQGKLNSDGYITLLREEVIPDIRRELGEERFRRAVWQQDGASPHRTRASIDYLHSIFGDRIVAMNSERVGGIDWPATSPEFSALDNHVWDAISRKLYYGENPPTDLDSLKSGLQRAFREVDRDEMKRAVTRGFRSRLRQCIAHGGGHFEGKKVKKEKEPSTPSSVDLLPHTYAHIRENDGSVKLIYGPDSYKLLPGESIEVPNSPFINIPPRHVAIISVDGNEEIRTGDSFPLFPGEQLISIMKRTDLEGREERTELEGDEESSSLPSEPPEIAGPCLVSVKFIPDGQDKIQDLNDRINDNLQHDLNIMQQILKLTASLKGPSLLPEIVSGMIEKATSQLAPQLVQRSPRSQVSLQSPRSKRSSSREANENIYKSPGLFTRSPRQSPSQSPHTRGKDNVVVDNNYFRLIEYPKRNHIYLDDLKSLENGVWLKNTIVNYYTAHLHSFVLPPADREKVFIFPTFFYFHLARNERVELFPEKTDMFKKLLLVIPICERDHWFLVIVVNNGEPLLIVLDSLGRDQSASVSIIRKYLAQEWFSQNQEVNSFFTDMKMIIPEKPQQDDGFNCGIYLLHYLEKILASLPMFLSEKTIHEATGGQWFSKNEIKEKRSIIAGMIINHAKREHKRNLVFPTLSLT